MRTASARHPSKPPSPRRFSTLPQLAVAVCGFVAAMILLDSGGLLSWAQRLDVGPMRTVAVPVAEGIHRAVAPLGLEQLRARALTALAQVGWSDDPAAVALVLRPKAGPAACPTPVANATFAANVPSKLPWVPNGGPRPTPPKLNLGGGLPGTAPLQPLPALLPGETREVGLAGDSMMAVGLSSTLERELPQHKQLRFIKLFRAGTGLARPDTFDWMREYPAMLGAERPPVILVAMGANDGQGFVKDGKVLAFGTPGWEAEYSARVRAYLEMLQANGAEVVWIGMPTMRSESYNQHIELVNRIDYAVVQESPRAVWWPSAALASGPDGGAEFRDFAMVDGRLTRLRQADGIHLSDDGAKLLTGVLLPWLDGPAPPPAVASDGQAVKIPAAPGQTGGPQ